MVDFIIMLLAGIVICVCVSFIWFTDFPRIIYSIFHVAKPKDYEQYSKLIKCPKYKKHKKHWILLFSLNSVIYALGYFIAFISFENTLLGMFSGLICAVFGFGIMSNKERKELEKIKSDLTK